MIPLQQTRFGEPDGNCLLASVASILEQPELLEESLPYNDEWFAALGVLLRTYGIDPGYFKVGDGSAGVPTGYSVCCGPGPRGLAHCCVALDGKLIFDPYPDGGGLVRIDDYITLRPNDTCSPAIARRLHPTAYQRVKVFHDRFGLSNASRPIQLPADMMIGRVEMILEELMEFLRAYRHGDLAGQADALIDCEYFLLGTGAHMGLPWDEIFDEVHDANMRKEPQGHAGTSKRRNKLDVIKPPGWEPPNIEAVLARHGAGVTMLIGQMCVVCGDEVTEDGCGCETKEIL